VRIAFLGDTLLGGEAEETIERRGYEHVLGGIAPLLRGADLVVINHEGPLTRRAVPEDKADTGRKRYWYRGRPEAARALAALGVRVASLANNHVLDFGLESLADTIDALDAAGIAHCGAGADEPSARRPAVVEAGGRTVGFVSCMQRYDIYVRERLYANERRGGCYRLRLRSVGEELDALAERADVRVALVHWGRNYRGVSQRQERLGAALAQRAHLVVGHHPHVPQRVDLRGGVPVLYSLGNGALGTVGRFHSGRPPYGIVALVDFDEAGRVSAVELRLLAVDNAAVAFRPEPVVGSEATAYLLGLVDPRDGWRAGAGGVVLELPAARPALEHTLA
jgi:poly-gamma-glutamate synthesis protein (capsule biosynthesis protein)